MQINNDLKWVFRLINAVLQDQIDLYKRLENLLGKCSMGFEMKSRLTPVEQSLLHSIHQIKTTCNELRPPLLKELGLALEDLFEKTQVFI